MNTLRLYPGVPFRVLNAAVGGLAALCFSTGCRHADLADERYERRVASLHRTTDAYLDRESRSPRRLARAGDFINERLRQKSRATRQNFREFHAYVERDLRRWKANQPRYRKDIARFFRGKPENIERTAIILFR